jgi:hypothetical protein
MYRSEGDGKNLHRMAARTHFSQTSLLVSSLLLLSGSSACHLSSTASPSPESADEHHVAPERDSSSPVDGAPLEQSEATGADESETCEVRAQHRALLFREGEAEPMLDLLESDRETFDPIIERINSDETILTVRAIGRSVCSPDGEGPENGRRLNIARGETLARILAEHGVPRERIETDSRCTFDPIADYEQSDLDLSREAVIEIVIRRAGPCPAQ